jgi:hypothetical protein
MKQDSKKSNSDKDKQTKRDGERNQGGHSTSPNK